MKKAPAAKDFSGRLRFLRDQRGLTQDELAELAGLSRDGISRLERGTRSPQLKTIKKLAQALGVDPEELLGSLEAAPLVVDRHAKRMSRMESYLRSVDDETAEQLMGVMDAAYKLARRAAPGPANARKGGRRVRTPQKPK